MRLFRQPRPLQWLKAISGLMRGPEFLIFMPAITLAGFWIGGERALVVLALGLPMFMLIAGSLPGTFGSLYSDRETSLDRVIGHLDRFLPRLSESKRNTACIVVQFNHSDNLVSRHGRNAFEQMMRRTHDRICGALRVGDFATSPGNGTMVVVLTPARRLDHATVQHLCNRLHEVVAEPVTFGGSHLYITCSIGYCLGGDSPEMTGRSILDAAQIAAAEAALQGAGTVQCWSEAMAERGKLREALHEELEEALDLGAIRAWFQPQISTDTGDISGVEALARWHHPTRGVLAPSEFLPLIESCDLSDRLSWAMLHQSLKALSDWDRAGLVVPTIAVNFSGIELRNPRLPERIRRELEQFGLKPARLTIEILETVVSGVGADAVEANISQLAAMGCGIDLDDFGTGHSSITTLRRFPVRRLKIDRSFVTRVDQDREQQQLVSAIISMAEQLSLETLAEGVETAAEHAMVAQLGCAYVQGYVIERPMTGEDCGRWIARHQKRSDSLPRITLRGK